MCAGSHPGQGGCGLRLACVSAGRTVSRFAAVAQQHNGYAYRSRLASLRPWSRFGRQDPARRVLLPLTPGGMPRRSKTLTWSRDGDTMVLESRASGSGPNGVGSDLTP